MKYASIANKKHYMDKFSYSIGLGIGQNLSSMGIANLSVDDFAQAIKDVLEGNQTAISHQEAREIVNKYFEELEAKMGAAAIEQGKAFLEENKKKSRCSNSAQRIAIRNNKRRYRQKASGYRSGKMPLRRYFD